MIHTALPWLISNVLVPWCEEVVYEAQNLAAGDMSLWRWNTLNRFVLVYTYTNHGDQNNRSSR